MSGLLLESLKYKNVLLVTETETSFNIREKDEILNEILLH